MEGECEVVRLQPFVHQVGGHSIMLMFDDTTVCKPLIKREHRFYETLPADLKPVTPEYRGVVAVSFAEDSAGNITVVAHPDSAKKDHGRDLSESLQSASTSSGSPAQSASTLIGSPAQSASSSLHFTSGKRSFDYVNKTVNLEQISENVAASHEKKQENTLNKSLHGQNPWNLRSHKKLEEMKNKSSHPQQFIKLENLASQFERPCILDIKMGPRQHGDDASEEKKRRQIKKCEESTSLQLGFRICGMQVYQTDTENFLCHNKYYGRRLDVKGVKETLFQFLHDGKSLHVGLVDQVVEKLRFLSDILSRKLTFRFYSSSLLVMYDGAVAATASPPDTAATSGSSPAERTSSCSPREDISPYIKQDIPKFLTPAVSKQNAISSNIQQKCTTHHPTDSSGTSANPVCLLQSDHCHSSDKKDDISERNNSSECVGNAPQCKCEVTYKVQNQHANKVNVRMIDFAHVTHSGFTEDSISHEGPDSGYLFGLENLIRMFSELKKHQDCTSHK